MKPQNLDEASTDARLSARVATAIDSIDLANNGYADIGRDSVVAEAVRQAGYIVCAGKNLHGQFTYIGSTKKAQECLSKEPFAVSTYRPVTPANEYDIEGAILSKQEAAMMDY